MWVASKTDVEKADRWARDAAAHLLPGEVVMGASRTSLARPPLDGLLLTNVRLLGFRARHFADDGPGVAVPFDEVVSVTVSSTVVGFYSLVRVTTAADVVRLGYPPRADAGTVVEYALALLQDFRAAPPRG